jgi:hypothetical protein
MRGINMGLPLDWADAKFHVLRRFGFPVVLVNARSLSKHLARHNWPACQCKCGSQLGELWRKTDGNHTTRPLHAPSLQLEKNERGLFIPLTSPKCIGISARDGLTAYDLLTVYWHGASRLSGTQHTGHEQENTARPAPNPSQKNRKRNVGGARIRTEILLSSGDSSLSWAHNLWCRGFWCSFRHSQAC